VGHRDRSAPTALRCHGYSLRERPSDRDLAAVEVHVLPAKTQRLAPAGPGREKEAQQVRELWLVFLGDVQKRVGFRSCPGLDLRHLDGFAARHTRDQLTDSSGGVVGDQLFLHR
jgi:hypothetical protein